MPNGDNNNRLTDDVVLDVWQFNSEAAKPISGKIEQPVMKIRPTDGKIGFAFVNGPLYFSMGGSPTFEDYSYQYWTASYDFFTSVAFAYDSLGNSWGAGAGGDINNASSDAFILMSSKFGIGLYTNRGSYDGYHNLRLERIAQYVDSVLEFDKQRIKTPSIATTTNGTATNVYMSYYDAINNELRFKSGSSANPKSYIRKVIQLDGNNYTGGWVNISENGNTLDIEDGDYVYFCQQDGTLISNDCYTVKGLYKGENNGQWGFQIVRLDSNNDASITPFVQPVKPNYGS